MTTREISGGYKTKKIFGTFDQVIDFDYADDGNMIVFSAEKEGKSDLFLFNVKQNTIRQISNDLYDETHPVFLKGSTSFVFSSNRNVDTIYAPSLKLNTLQDNTNLFLYEPNVSTTKFKRLTNTKFHESAPLGFSMNEIAYLQDETGIYNLSILDINTGISKQVTNYQQDIHQFDLSYAKNLSFVMLHKCKELLFVNHAVNLSLEVPKPIKTPRREAFNFIENIFNSSVKPDSTIIVPTTDSLNDVKKIIETIPNQDIVKHNTQIINEEITFESNQEPQFQKTTNTIPSDTTNLNSEEEINVNNYTFESEGHISIGNSDDERNQLASGISSKFRTEESIKVSDFKPMRPMLNVDYTISTILFDPLRGFGLQAKVAVSDMLENHRFTADGLSSINLSMYKLYFEYEYLKRRLDYKFRYEKQIFEKSTEQSYPQKASLNKFELSFTYPFSPFARLSITPFGLSSNLYLLGSPSTEDKYNIFIGGRAEFVFDNSEKKGMNMIVGTRMRFTSDNYLGTKEINNNFARIEADIRNYKKIHREIIFATRLSTGTFFGKNAPNYMIGGIDNWVFSPDPIINSSKSPLYYDEGVDNRKFLFNQFITSLRGFNYSQLYGQSHILFNAELRIPVVKYFYKGLINSEFLRNFQLIGFYDIGSAWTGTNPFSSENSFNTTYIESGSIKAKVINYKNPFLSSFGAGIHTHLLGYYVKIDLAFPIQDYAYKSPRLMLSLGYDF